MSITSEVNRKVYFIWSTLSGTPSNTLSYMTYVNGTARGLPALMSGTGKEMKIACAWYVDDVRKRNTIYQQRIRTIRVETTPIRKWKV